MKSAGWTKCPAWARASSRPHAAISRSSEQRTTASSHWRNRCPHKGGPLSQGIVHGSHDLPATQLGDRLGDRSGGRSGSWVRGLCPDPDIAGPDPAGASEGDATYTSSGVKIRARLELALSVQIASQGADRYCGSMKNLFRYFDSSPEVIRLVVLMDVKYPLWLRTWRTFSPNVGSTSASEKPIIS